MVHPVDEIYVDSPWRAPQWLGSSRAPPEGMGRRVPFGQVGFGLDDSQGTGSPAGLAHENVTEECSGGSVRARRESAENAPLLVDRRDAPAAAIGQGASSRVGWVAGI